MAFVHLRDVHVEFPIYNARTRSLKNRILARTSDSFRRFAERNNETIVVKSLQGVTFDLQDGDRVGLIGRNGAGKSTLLRVLSGIYEPTAGNIEISGQVVPMTDITLGMDMEASGYENIVLRGIVLGMTRTQARAMIPDIEEFTELGAHLNLPVRTYSSGMRLRLAFGISTCLRPEILVMDEVIGAGDHYFIEKSRKRLNDLIANASILAIASHDESILRNFCNKGIFMEDGKLIYYGDIDSAIKMYNEAYA